MRLATKKRLAEAGLAVSLAAVAAAAAGHLRLERAIEKAVAEGRLLAVLAGAGLGSYELVVWGGLAVAAVLGFWRRRLSRQEGL